MGETFEIIVERTLDMEAEDGSGIYNYEIVLKVNGNTLTANFNNQITNRKAATIFRRLGYQLDTAY